MVVSPDPMVRGKEGGGPAAITASISICALCAKTALATKPMAPRKDEAARILGETDLEAPQRDDSPQLYASSGIEMVDGHLQLAPGAMHTFHSFSIGTNPRPGGRAKPSDSHDGAPSHSAWSTWRCFQMFCPCIKREGKATNIAENSRWTNYLSFGLNRKISAACNKAQKWIYSIATIHHSCDQISTILTKAMFSQPN